MNEKYLKMYKIKRLMRIYVVSLLQRSRIPEEVFLIGIAGIIGVLSGFGASIFRILIDFFYNLFWHNLKFSLLNASLLERSITLLIPMTGGLITGIIINKFAKEVEGIGVPEVIEAVALKGGIIRPRVIWLKVITAGLFIGSGGSAGRVGPIVQIGSAIGSFFGKLFKLSGRRVKVLIACGAASGIAGTFNAPMAGILFSLEIILGDITIETFSPVVFSTLATSIVVKSILGKPLFLRHIHNLHISFFDLPWFVLLGGIVGLFGALFIKFFYRTVDFFKELNFPNYIKPAIGGAVLGLIALEYPYVLGLGLGTIYSAVLLKYSLSFFLILFVAKFLATSISLGSGGSGGIFSPGLYMGAMIGAVFVLFLSNYHIQLHSNKSVFVIIGMFAFIGGIIRAPLTSTVLIYEITDNHKIVLPVLIATLVSTELIYLLIKHSIYTMKLARKGIVIRKGKEENILKSVKVSDIMLRKFVPLRDNMKIKEIVNKITGNNFIIFPVLNKKNELVGMINLQDIRNFIFDNNYEELIDLVVAIDIAQINVITISEDDTLCEALQKFSVRDNEQLPVVSKDNPKKVVGILSKTFANLRYQKQAIDNIIKKHIGN